LPLSFTAVNHIGLFVAKAKGFFAEAGLGEVTLLSPHVDQYKTTPAQLVERGDALLAVCPSESIISSATRPASSPRPALRAVAALLQEDTVSSAASLVGHSKQKTSWKATKQPTNQPHTNYRPLYPK
jgi:ABC-type nitrate/sulfonate/bicarbonate transport system substrate-binding protein